MNLKQEHPKVSTPQRRLARGLISVSVALTLVGLASAMALRAPAETPVAAAPGVAVQVVRAQAQTEYRVGRIFTGRVEARRSSPLGFELPGMVREVLVNEGDPVAAGALLARLDTARLQTRRGELEAALAEAEANLALARVTLERMQGVVETGGVSRQGLDEAQEAYRAARAARLLAESRIATLDVDLAKAELKAPFAGIVTRRMVDEGQVLDSGRPVLQLQERAAPEARVGVAGWAVDALRAGEAYTLRIAGRDREARLKAVLPTRGQTTRTVDALFHLDEQGPVLRSGDLVELSLDRLVAEPGFWLPIGALAENRRGLWSVYTAAPAGNVPLDLVVTHQLVPRAVEILHQEAERVFVRGALQPGELLVTDGLHRVVPGQLVRVLPAEVRSERIALGGI